MKVAKSRSAIGKVAVAVIIVVVIVIAAAAAFLVSGSGSYSSTSSSSPPSTSSSAPATTTNAAPKQYKIAIIGASASDAYFAEFFSSSAQQAAKALSTPQEQVTVTPAYSVPASQIISVSQSYASQGYQMIVLYVDYYAQYVPIAKAVPNVIFVDEYATPNGWNASAYNYNDPESNHYSYNATNIVGWDVNLGGAYYLAGVAGGLISHSQKLGYDTAFNIPLLAQWYNDFAKGAHSVNANIPVYYGFANDWVDATKGAAQTDAMVARGADVIASTGDTQSIGAAKEAIAKGAYGIGYPVNLNNLSASYMLGSAYFNATALTMNFIRDGVANSSPSHYYSIDYAHNGDRFILNPALVSSGTFTSAMQAKLKAAEDAIKNYQTIIGFDSNFPPQPSS